MPVVQYNLSNPKNADADLQTAQRALEELAVIARDPNNINSDLNHNEEQSIHCYTNRIGDICNTFFVPFDATYTLTQKTKTNIFDKKVDFETAALEILLLSPSNQIDNINLTLKNIRCYQGSIENEETHLDVMGLLIKTWELAKKVNYEGAIGVVLDNLNHNVVEGGGCYPGIAARLAFPYSIFLRQALMDQIQPNLHVDHHSGAEADGDAALAIALSNSLLLNYNREQSVAPLDLPPPPAILEAEVMEGTATIVRSAQAAIVVDTDTPPMEGTATIVRTGRTATVLETAAPVVAPTVRPTALQTAAVFLQTITGQRERTAEQNARVLEVVARTAARAANIAVPPAGKTETPEATDKTKIVYVKRK